MLQSLKACPSGPLRVKVPWDLQLKVLCLSELRSEMIALHVMGLGVHEAWFLH